MKTHAGRPALVAVGYNRPASLERLLRSLQRLVIAPGAKVPLVVSLDGADAEVRRVAEQAEWAHGDKRIMTHPAQLGLREHILSCGDLTEEYGTVVVLEDDLLCAPGMYAYVEAALDAHEGEDSICGYALHQPRILEGNQLHFHPATGGYDTYLARVACSWGQVWTRPGWAAFRDWYDTNESAGVTVGPNVPSWVARWPESSWKKYFQRYMAETRKWKVYPSSSLTSNYGDPGMHVRTATRQHVTVLSESKTWRFAPVVDAWRYDAWFEPTPTSLRKLWPFLPENLEVDLHGSKASDEVRGEFLLSPRVCRDALRSFAYRCLPLAYNLDEPGHGLFLGRADQFVAEPAHYEIASFLNGDVSPRVALRVLKDRARFELRRQLRRLPTRR